MVKIQLFSNCTFAALLWSTYMMESCCIFNFALMSRLRRAEQDIFRHIVYLMHLCDFLILEDTESHWNIVSIMFNVSNVLPMIKQITYWNIPDERSGREAMFQQPVMAEWHLQGKVLLSALEHLWSLCWVPNSCHRRSGPRWLKSWCGQDRVQDLATLAVQGAAHLHNTVYTTKLPAWQTMAFWLSSLESPRSSNSSQ